MVAITFLETSVFFFQKLNLTFGFYLINYFCYFYTYNNVNNLYIYYSGSQLLWNKLRITVMGAALFRKAGAQRASRAAGATGSMCLILLVLKM